MENSEFAIRKEYETIFYRQIGDIIRMHRRKSNLTQDDLGFLLNISRVSINNIELGKQRLPLHIISYVCEVLEINLLKFIPKYSYGMRTISELKTVKIENYKAKL